MLALPRKGDKKDMEGFFVHVIAYACPMMENHALGKELDSLLGVMSITV